LDYGEAGSGRKIISLLRNAGAAEEYEESWSFCNKNESKLRRTLNNLEVWKKFLIRLEVRIF
jgi:hypothetical protein